MKLLCILIGTVALAAPPVSNPGATQVIRAGTQFTLTGSGTPSGGATITGYAWAQQGASDCSIDSPSSATTTVTCGATQGTKTLRLTVTDSNEESGYADVEIGSVVTDALGRVTIPDAGIAFLLGPLTRWGTSPWSWFDSAEKANADFLGPALLDSSKLPETATLPGTVDFWPGNDQLYIDCSAGQTCNFAANFTSDAGEMIAVRWNPDGEAAGSGRAVFYLTTVDNTGGANGNGRISIIRMFGDNRYSQANGLQYQKVETNAQAAYWGEGLQNGAGSNNWNYYDVTLALYRLYYRTGLDTYLTYARTLADNWWVWGLDHGHKSQLPRTIGLLGAMVRALDGKPERWPGIIYWQDTVDWTYGYTYKNIASNPWTTTTSPDVREAGYSLAYIVALARLAANADGTPNTTVRSAYCGYLNDAIQYGWSPYQSASGQFSMLFVQSTNAYFPYAGDGTLTWQAGPVLRAFALGYSTLKDSCSNSTRAEELKTVWKKALDFIWSVRDTDRGQYYDVNYYTNGQGRDVWKAGTASISNGSTTVTGTSAKFMTSEGSNAPAFACDGTDYIYFASDTNGAYKVMSCASDNELTIETAWPYSNVTTSQYKQVDASGATCGPPGTADYCNTPGRSDLGILPAAYGAYYALTGDLTYKTIGDDMFSAAFGYNAGAGADGGQGSLVGNFNPANFPDFVAACDPDSGTSWCGYGKWYGMNAGIGSSQNYLVYRLGAGQGPAVWLGNIRKSGNTR